MQQFLLSILETLSTQILVLFGLFFVLGFILTTLQEQTQKNYYRSIGWKGILWTAWIGTPVHELSHLFFALLFRHRIVSLKLFSPNQETGELGEVQHSYTRGSIYQVAGNFFIGVAPLIGGSCALAFLAYLVIPHGGDVQQTLLVNPTSLRQILQNATTLLGQIFTPLNLASPLFWLCLYLSFCVSSHMAPSKVDRRSMWHGFGWLLVALILFNIVGAILNYNATQLVFQAAGYLSILTALFLYAIVVSLCHFLLSLIFAALKS